MPDNTHRATEPVNQWLGAHILIRLDTMALNLTNLPEVVRLRAQSLGSTGEWWIATLGEIVGNLALQWQFVLRGVRSGGSESLILVVDLEDDSSAILKVGLPGVWPLQTFGATRPFHGTGN